MVGDCKLGSLEEKPFPFLYLPYLQRYSGKTTLHVRIAGDPGAGLGALRHRIRTFDASLPLTEVQAVDTAVSRALWWPRVTAFLAVFLSLLSLAVAAVGVYGLTACVADRRRREIGLRMAVGAPRASLVRLVAGDGLRTAMLGTALGGWAAHGLMSWAASLFHGPGLPSAAGYLAAGGILLAVVAAAEIGPSLRAAAGDPQRILKEP